MTVYKFRFEAIQDVLIFFLTMDRGFLYVEYGFDLNINPLSGTMTFASDYTLDKLYDILDSVEDAHVIKETIQPIEKYTGLRNYSL